MTTTGRGWIREVGVRPFSSGFRLIMIGVGQRTQDPSFGLCMEPEYRYCL